jgi:hypothetical protein
MIKLLATRSANIVLVLISVLSMGRIASGLETPPPPAKKKPEKLTIKPLADLPADLSVTRVLMRSASRPATSDLIAMVWQCRRCGRLNAAQRILPQQPPFDSMRDVRPFLLRLGLGQGGSWKKPTPEPCATCRLAPPPLDKLQPREVFFFRYFPESGCDAVARLPVIKGKPGTLSWFKLSVSGTLKKLPVLSDQEVFAEAMGRVLSVREAWSELIRNTLRRRKHQILKAAPGYYLVCRLRSADAGQDAALQTALNLALIKKHKLPFKKLRWINLTSLQGSNLEKSLPGYRRWLPGQRRQLEAGLCQAHAVILPEIFWTTLNREIEPSGLKISSWRQGNPRLQNQGVYLPLSNENLMEKTVFAGLSFGESIHHILRPRMLLLAKTRIIYDQALTVLKNYQLTVLKGRLLIIRKKGSTAKQPNLASLDLQTLAGAVDLRNPGTLASTLTGMLGINPDSGKIEPPDLSQKSMRKRGQWLFLKLRPEGFYKKLGITPLQHQWRGLDAIWSLESIDFSSLLQKQGSPSQAELKKRFEKNIDQCTFVVQVAKGFTLEGIQARFAVGPEIASALINKHLRRGLARRLKAPQKNMELSFWAPTTNIVLITQLPVTGRIREDFEKAVQEIFKAEGIAPGPVLDLEIREKMEASPAGRFTSTKK